MKVHCTEFRHRSDGKQNCITDGCCAMLAGRQAMNCRLLKGYSVRSIFLLKQNLWVMQKATVRVTGIFVPTYFRSQERKYRRWNFRSLEHSLPNAISKTWSFRSPCFKCVFLSKVTRTASSVYRPTRLMPSHQSHETVPSRNRSHRNRRRR